MHLVGLVLVLWKSLFQFLYCDESSNAFELSPTLMEGDTSGMENIVQFQFFLSLEVIYLPFLSSTSFRTEFSEEVEIVPF